MLHRGAVARWLSADAGVHPRACAFLLASLLGVHEVLFVHALPLGTAEGAYLQLLLVAQCVLLTCTTAVAMSLAPRAAPWIAGGALTLPVLFYVDALVVARIDRHLPAIVLLLLDSRLEDNRRLLAATGIDLRVVTGLLVALAVVVAAGVWGVRHARKARPPAGRLRTTRARLVAGCAATWLTTCALEAGAAHAVRATSWSRFGRAVPQVLSALGPVTRARGSVRAALRPRPASREVAAWLGDVEIPAAAPPGDVFFFVVESLRADALERAETPAMTSLAEEGLRFEAAVSGGNVTQYGWYSLFTALPALYWERDEAAADGMGALPLRVARKRGWRIEVLTANDLSYMRLDEALFGASHALADAFLDESASEGSPALRDEEVMRELGARAARAHPPTVFVVSLDATHLPYTWGDGFAPPFAPFADPRHYMRVQVDPSERLAVVNRYRDAVAFDDALVGRFVDALRSAGAYDDATVVVAGDHGEEFWEHGLASHGSEPCSAQTHVALLLKPSRAMRAGGDWSSPRPLASGIDAWPTLLDAAGVRWRGESPLAGASVLRGGVGAALSADQRYWYRPARFVLDDGRRKVELQLTDPDHPFREQGLDLLVFTDENDAPTDEGLTASEYVAILRGRFGADLERFFAVRW
jgi:membrane-anchored protein YejM (alkaline phosphatase superfamily)